ncbi:LuxR C-terminal-related transcriptional regulator [Paenibacillus sp. MZ04-78.2]|uniref:LuxR C-terminal-related transcriptional regulator n=1 Tax=Paenibacillus sp. MZ04-78.2 TaxID=2962034 RepID=UPI0020B7ECDB|nr:LuxR C-terminal-related transcriptional regulator [Paenibacillus sp. MZ04-78.2]MCP3774889.1 LuxR C-terminal-related transcriptional regulator [Paenibacillus sp. MZ04-78.2]
MWKTQIKKLQRVQDTYSSICGLSIFITDADGAPLTRISGDQALARKIWGQPQPPLQERLAAIIREIGWKLRPVVYQYLRGPKMIVMPFRVGEQPPFYVWSGMIVEKSSRDLIRRIIETDFADDADDWRRVLDLVPDTPESLKDELVDKVAQFADIASTWLEQANSGEAHARDLERLHDLFGQAGAAEPAILQSAAERLMAAAKLDFAGFAVYGEDERLCIRHMVGVEGCEKLIGSQACLGESFLGQIGLTGKMRYWEDVTWDPRSGFFTDKGLHPQAFVGFPAKIKDRMIGVLFGGRLAPGGVASESIELGRLIAHIAASHLHMVRLEEAASQQMARLSTLLGVAQAIVDVNELRSVLCMLADVSHHLIQGAFSCILWKEPAVGTGLQAISRGMTVEQIEHYAKDAAVRQFANRPEGALRHPAVFEADNGVVVCEIPLVCSGEVKGILGVGLHNEKEVAVYRPFLTALALLGEIRLQHLQGTARLKDRERTELLHSAIAEWNEPVYRETVQAQELARRFARKLRLPEAEIEELSEACMLSGCEPAFLERMAGSHPGAKLLRDARELMREFGPRPGNAFSVKVQILSLILLHVRHRENPAAMPYTAVEPALRQAFAAFVQGQEVIESLVTLREASETIDADTGKDLPAPGLMESHIPLTPREREVFNLILRGLSNLEIAEKLFISTHTVKNHITKIYEKLGVSDRTQALAKVYLTGLQVKI